MEQRCLEVTENTIETTLRSELGRGKLWELTVAVLPVWVEEVGLPRSFWGDDQPSPVQWSGNLAYILLVLGGTGWIMLVSCKRSTSLALISRDCVQRQLVVWSWTSNRYRSFIFHNSFLSDVDHQMEMFWSSRSKLYKWRQQAFHWCSDFAGPALCMAIIINSKLSNSAIKQSYPF